MHRYKVDRSLDGFQGSDIREFSYPRASATISPPVDIFREGSGIDKDLEALQAGFRHR